MVILTINNSYSKISGLSIEQEKELRDLLSYAVGGSSAYFSGFGIRKRSLLSKRGEFPTGLLSRIRKQFATSELKIVDSRMKPKAKTPRKFLTDLNFYTWQKEAACIASILNGTVSATTGSGKSNLMALIAAMLNFKTLIVVPTLELKKQLTETFLSLFGSTPDITIKNIDDPSLKDETNYDLLIIEECHHSAAKTYQVLNKTAWTKIYHRICVTATDFRNDPEEQLLYESISGPTIYCLDFKTAVEKKYVCPVESYYIEVPKQETDAYTYREVYNKLVVHNNERNDLIAITLLRLQNVEVATLCLIKEVAHGKILSEMTGIPFVSGADEDSRAYIQEFKEGKIKTLIGTEGVLGEGIDLKPCEYVLLAGLGKAKSAIMQKIGRCVRTYPGKESGKVIIFRDTSHKFLLKHFNIQKKILKEVYGSITLRLG